MARQDPHTEYIVRQDAYETALASLPATGTEGQTALSTPVVAREYRQNISQTINAGKWVLWNLTPQLFAFVWRNGAWQPPANVVVLPD